ncbi:zinc-dependent peptidase [Ferruginibacter lapsinanis]|uniref:zinc-dependent peptidase n=1 Tax=Ferruginibacter lapsinanis TaxID=563172 RepID=UPI001E2DD787|nr:zinc-dependent peptidase [Ferruginibacter lapsinanis]UEG50069.1 zinc-dependent peptidase [Ferruginibacter lapsinanis]
MPQAPTEHIVPFTVDDVTYFIDTTHLPSGFDTLSADLQNKIILKTYKNDSASFAAYEKPNLFPMYCFVIFFIILFVWGVIQVIKRFKYYSSNLNYVNPDYYETGPYSTKWVDIDESPKPSYLIYHGNTLNFSRITLTTVLFKHFPFYNSLDGFEKDKFINRLEKFIESKIFIIHDESGFREMPILISASAIQLTFGLEKYLLPYFDTINIYPQEFLGVQPFIRFLEGNVSGNTINLSWKHFLEGFQFPEDGENVGLHEMSHALYYQTFVVGESVDNDFKNTFETFNISGNKAFAEEHALKKDLYSDYAMKNFQEFWAESIEIFFEKPLQMRAVHPELYAAMSDLLNQSPADRIKA